MRILLISKPLYEQSSDYGGSEPTWRGLLIAVAALGVRRGRVSPERLAEA